jgi:hypothetical protein
MNDRDKLKHLLDGDWLYHEQEPETEADMPYVDGKRMKLCFYTKLDGYTLATKKFGVNVWYPTYRLPPDSCQLVTWACGD